MHNRRCPGCGVREAELHKENCPQLLAYIKRQEWLSSSPPYFWLGAEASNV